MTSPVSKVIAGMTLPVSVLAATLTTTPVLAAGPLQHDAAVGSRYISVDPPGGSGACARFPMAPCGPGVGLPPLRVLVGPARLPLTATHDAVQTNCPGKGLGAACGTVTVPLDRRHPNNGTIKVFFELFTHIGGGPARSTLLVNFGGPGIGTTTNTYSALWLFAHNLTYDDLLLIDDRGRGFSSTIDCIPLQQGNGPFADAEADCAAQLGQAASRYGTGDVAQDTEAVRAALGYDKVDYYGASYGGEDVTAYATRFGLRLRSIVLDAPAGTPDLQPFISQQYTIRAIPRMVSLACAYSPTCRPDHPNAEADLNWLVGYVQARPVDGNAYNGSGKLVHVRIDEERLLDNIVAFPSGGSFVSTGEIPAASRALRQGDPGPLLRLGAEGFFTLSGVLSNPNVNAFSPGAQFATNCVDNVVPWKWSEPVPERLASFAHAVRALPPGYFSPFSKAAVTTQLSYLITGFGPCMWWQKPTPSSPVTPPHPVYPRVPTLVLDGNMDDFVPLEEVTKVVDLFPGSTLVTVAEAGHTAGQFTMCAANLLSQFIETLRIGDTRCTQVPEVVFPAVGRFPLLSKDAVPAAVDPRGGNKIGLAQRKVVTVALAAATDALKRTTLAGTTQDHCLRAGTFQAAYSPTQTKLTFAQCSFAKDVGVNGTSIWGADFSFVADLNLSGPGTPGGRIHVIGTFRAKGPVGNFEITGTIGGLNVAVLVPEA
jgi:pimeloyl-ACP methyl ester carboxylesterase